MSEVLETLEAEIEKTSPAHRGWILPILRCLAAMELPAAPRDIKARLAEFLAEDLTESQIDYFFQKRFSWIGYQMKAIGLISNENGRWSTTELGEELLRRQEDERLLIPTDVPELSAEDSAREAEAETVDATHFAAYEIPLLGVLATGANKKKEIFERLEKDLGEDLLPGDRRTMPSGAIVWEYRASWALSNLKKAGETRNPGWALWEITEAGRLRLQQERESWRIGDYRNSRASVVVRGQKPRPDLLPPIWNPDSWTAFSRFLPASQFELLDARLRPDLGPSPKPPLARNVILYGPPGTGKTFLALAAARALSGGDVGPGGSVRVVQFHPSYAYEDFVQGLRPDLEHTELRYRLSQGPFLEVCEQAGQDPERFHVLVIDEINRGDPARIFGELLYALEYRDQHIELALGGELVVPSNLVVIGTMNSVDRSVALVDYALRRRFGFVRVDPNPDVIIELRSSAKLAPAAAGLLTSFNDWLEQRLDSDHRLGHSFFLNPAVELEVETDIKKIWKLDVRPLLEEYFFGDRATLEEAGKKWSSTFRKQLAELEAEDE